MRMDELEQQALSMTQMMTGRDMVRVSEASSLLEAIAEGEVFLTFADTQLVTNGIRDNRVYFFNPESSDLPVGSSIPAGELPQRRVEEECEESISTADLIAWLNAGRVRALRVVAES